jgi:PPOX class probable F420-dependent enzyme
MMFSLNLLTIFLHRDTNLENHTSKTKAYCNSISTVERSNIDEGDINSMSSPSDRMSVFSTYQYINLETYRRNGQAIATPVWFTIYDGRISVVTRSETGKVKRLRNNSKVRIVPSGIRGQPKGEWLKGKAVFAAQEELDQALKQRNKKYGLKARLSGLFSRTKGKLIGIIISLD